jgi:hypothetical protein
MAKMDPLRRRMIEDMKVRDLSPVTQRCYMHAVVKFAQYFKRSPDQLRDLTEASGLSRREVCHFFTDEALRFVRRTKRGAVSMRPGQGAAPLIGQSQLGPR